MYLASTYAHANQRCTITMSYSVFTHVCGIGQRRLVRSVSIPGLLSLTTKFSPWSRLAAEKKARQLEVILQKWLISVSPNSTLDVIYYPEKCGISLQTRSKSRSVTTAFYKQGIVSQELVIAAIDPMS